MDSKQRTDLIAELDRLVTWGCSDVRPAKALPDSARWIMMKASTAGDGFTAWATPARVYVVHDTHGILRIIHRNG